MVSGGFCAIYDSQVLTATNHRQPATATGVAGGAVDLPFGMETWREGAVSAVRSSVTMANVYVESYAAMIRADVLGPPCHAMSFPLEHVSCEYP